jgi:hypothetical protein
MRTPTCVWLDRNGLNGLRLQGLGIYLPDFITNDAREVYFVGRGHGTEMGCSEGGGEGSETGCRKCERQSSVEVQMLKRPGRRVGLVDTSPRCRTIMVHNTRNSSDPLICSRTTLHQRNLYLWHTFILRTTSILPVHTKYFCTASHPTCSN